LLQGPEILQRVRDALGAQVSALNDGDIHVAVRSWAQEHSFRSVYPPGSPISKAQEYEIVTRVKKVISAIPTHVTVGSKDAAIKISATGPTATLKSGSMRYSVSGSLERGASVQNASAWGGLRGFDLTTELEPVVRAGSPRPRSRRHG
jgi:hypothetical protein